MILLEEIAKELAAKGLVEITGATQDIWVTRMNEDVCRGVLLTNRLNGSKRYEETPHYRTTRFNVICRGTDRKDTIDRSYAIAEELHTQGDRQLGGILIKYMAVETDPRPYPISEGDLMESLVVIRANYVIQDYNY